MSLQDRLRNPQNIEELMPAAEQAADRIDALRTAAQAVIDRWDTPLWKDVPATAEYINELRNVLK